jgi:excisionase family DNA binding protein
MSGYLTIGQAAKRLRLEVDTVRRLERAGLIKAARTAGGHRRFAAEEVERYRRKKTHVSKPEPFATERRPPRPASRSVYESSSSDSELGLVLEDEDLEDFGWEDEELDVPPPVRHIPIPLPKPMPYTPYSSTPTDAQERARLQNIKRQGRNAVPWGIPTVWEGRVIAELERFVTPIQFPAYLTSAKASDLVTSRVEEVLRPYHEAVKKAERDRQAAEQKELQELRTCEEQKRRLATLMAHGIDYARQETSDWDHSPGYDARVEVVRILGRDLKHDMTNLEVESLVDDVLDQWDDDDDEEE